MLTVGFLVCGVLTLSAVPIASAQQSILTKIGLLKKAAAPVPLSVGWKDLGSGARFYGCRLIN